MSNKKIIYINSSALKSFSCKRKLFYTIYDGYTLDSNAENISLAYGNAFHKFLEAYYKGAKVTEACNIAVEFYKTFNDILTSEKEFRTTSHLISSITEYAKRYKTDPNDFKPLLDNENKPIVEYKFAYPIHSTETYDLILVGTLDLVCSYLGYKTVVVDHKTTSSSYNYRENFFHGYEHNIQTMLYTKVWKEANNLDEYPPVVINGIFLKKETIAAKKQNIFDGVNLDRSTFIIYNEEQMKEFEKWLDISLQEIVNLLDTNDLYQPNFSFCHATFKTCEFFNACKLGNLFRETYMNARFIKKPYEPLKFR